MASSVDRASDCEIWRSRRVAYITATVVFGSSWLVVAISDFGSARAAGIVAFTSKPVVFSHAEVVH